MVSAGGRWRSRSSGAETFKASYWAHVQVPSFHSQKAAGPFIWSRLWLGRAGGRGVPPPPGSDPSPKLTGNPSNPHTLHMSSFHSHGSRRAIHDLVDGAAAICGPRLLPMIFTEQMSTCTLCPVCRPITAKNGSRVIQGKRSFYL